MSKQLTKEEALALIAQAHAACPELRKEMGKTTVTRNKAGGVFIRIPDVKLVSSRTGNAYAGGVNINSLEQAKEIFLNPSKLQLIQAFIKAEVAKESTPVEPEQTEQTAS